MSSRAPLLYKWRTYRPATNHRIPPWLIILALIVYTGLFVLTLYNPGNSVKTDSLQYLKLAENLRAHHIFSDSPASPYLPNLYRLPLYPLFLALLHATTPFTIVPAVLLQCGMAFLLIFLVWPTFYRFGGLTGATLGTCFLCFDLMAVLHQNLILTEALYTLIFTVGFCFAIRVIEYPTFPRTAAAGLLFGLAALIKPVAIVPAGVFLLCSFKYWKNVLWIGLITLSLPASWVLRNWVLTGSPVYTIQGNFTLLQYPAACAVAIDTGRTRADVFEELEAKLRSEGFTENTDPLILSRAYRRMALQIIEQHPLGTIKYCLSGAIRILGGTGVEMILDQMPSPPSTPVRPTGGSELIVSGSGTRALLKAHPALIPIQLAYTVFLLGGYLLFGRGIRELIRRREVLLAAFLVLSGVLILMISTLPGGTYRLRLLLLPFLAFGISVGFAAPRTSPKIKITPK